MIDQKIRRQELYSLLGDLPSRHHPISCKTLSVSEQKTYTVEKLLLELNGIETVPAYLVKPLTERPYPVVLYNHAHGGDYTLGKDELIRGRAILQDPPYAEVFTAHGIAALCIDTWLFGERRGRAESEEFKRMDMAFIIMYPPS